jgi:hypothetical protein
MAERPHAFDLANPLELVSRQTATDMHDEAGTAERDAREKHDVEANVDDITAGLGFRQGQARSPPRSEPQNSQDLRPKAMPMR